MGKARDITGQRFGSLVAVKNTFKQDKARSYIWLFKCDCGNYVERRLNHVSRMENKGKCKHCHIKDVGDFHRTHGVPKKNKVYVAWIHIKSRCLNHNDKSYPRYGAKGITIQEDWINDFIAFRDYIGNPPDDGQRWSIDRIDNSLGYQEGNIRWATDKQQARNKGKMKTNTTGVTGVSINNTRTRYITFWTEFDGKSRSKSFSIKDYGEELAFFMACEYREQMINLLNLQGAGYSENHGK